MVEIVGEDSKFKYRVTCENCSSILEYTSCETFTKKITDYIGDSETYRYVNCPKCHYAQQVRR